MTYVFDTTGFIVLGHYFRDRFPSFWSRFNDLVAAGRIISVREVYKELDVAATTPQMIEWVHDHRGIFLAPTSEETEFVRQIFSVRHFQQLISKKQQVRGGPAADPFVIASAYVNGGCVVTQEKAKQNAARIPNVCAYFHIDCTDVEGFMTREGWAF